MAGGAAAKRDLEVIKEEAKPEPREALTSFGASISEVLQLCLVMRYEAMITGCSGIGKTFTARRWVEEHNWDAIFFTVGVAVHTYGNLLLGLAEILGTPTSSYYTLRERLDTIIERLTRHPRLIVLDEAHFCNWKMLETLRQIHDESGAGIVYLGQPRLIDQMRGKADAALLYDQIYGRLAIRKVFGKGVPKDDVKIVADSLCPGLPAKALTFLHKKAQLEGKLRLVRYILEVSMEVAKTEGVPVDFTLISRVSNSLSL